MAKASPYSNTEFTGANLNKELLQNDFLRLVFINKARASPSQPKCTINLLLFYNKLGIEYSAFFVADVVH